MSTKGNKLLLVKETITGIHSSNINVHSEHFSTYVWVNASTIPRTITWCAIRTICTAKNGTSDDSRQIERDGKKKPHTDVSTFLRPTC